MEKRKLNTKLIFAIGATALLIIAAVVVVILYKKPLGAPLAAPAGMEAAGAAAETAASSATAAADALAPNGVTSKPAQVCGETAVWNSLVVRHGEQGMYLRVRLICFSQWKSTMKLKRFSASYFQIRIPTEDGRNGGCSTATAIYAQTIHTVMFFTGALLH